MTSLGDTFDGRRGQRRALQLVGGAGLLLAGSATFGLGFARVVRDALTAAGLPAPVALSVGMAAVGLLVPGVLVAIRTRLPGDRGGEWLAPGGGLVGASVLAVLAAGATGAPISGATAWLLGLVYAAGLSLIVGSVLAASLGDTSSRPQVAYRRTTARHDGPTPADGGEDEDDDLTFPLDEE